MIRIAIKQDDDGHTYIIPYQLSNIFDDLLENDEDMFIENFDKYNLGGCISSEEIYVKDDYFN